MIVVGEKINTTRKRIGEAVERRDAESIVEVAREQAEAGADYIDVNAGTFPDREVECLCWLVENVQSEINLPLFLDSPNPEALSQAIKHHKGEPMINSISLEEDRYRSLLPVVRPVSFSLLRRRKAAITDRFILARMTFVNSSLPKAPSPGG
jgi:5-methyltetrahydrofolate--homocysteine methyltransferase